MKRIGVLGGASWPSTIDYYTLLNTLVLEKLGGFHSANLILKSMDYHAIKSCYGAGWDAVPSLLEEQLADLAMMRPDCILIANNTLHKALDAFTDGQAFQGIPLIHIVRETGKAAQKVGYQRLLLLGTKFTMEDGYYAGVLKRDFGLDVEIPNEPDRDAIQAIQTPLSLGEDASLFEDQMSQIIASYSHFDAVVPACTELPLVVRADNTELPVLNPTQLQCEAAVQFALDE